MRFIIGVSSAAIGWAIWLAVGGAIGFLTGALALAVSHLLGIAVWQKVRKPGERVGDSSRPPYLLGWFVSAGLLLLVAGVVMLMGRQIQAEHVWVVERTANLATNGDYPGNSVLEFGVLLAAAGLATLVAGIVRWFEHRRTHGSAALATKSS